MTFTKEQIAQSLDVLPKENRPVMTAIIGQLQAEMNRTKALLPTELFSGSKDWTQGNTVERIEWLLSMYESSKQEVERLEKLVDDIEDDLEAERRFNFDRT